MCWRCGTARQGGHSPYEPECRAMRAHEGVSRLAKLAELAGSPKSGMADSAVGKAVDGAAAEAESAARQAAPWIEPVARVGFAAKGIVYGLIGVLALLSAVGPGGSTTDEAARIDRIAEQSYGVPLLIAIGIGLFGYALWALPGRHLRPGGQGRDQADRLSPLGPSVRRAWRLGGRRGLRRPSLGTKGELDHWPAAQRARPTCGGAIGLLVIAVGIVQLVNAAKAFKDNLKLGETNEGQRRGSS